MRIGKEIVEEIVAHAREDLPNECCGMIGGADGVARTVYRARNEFESPLRYGVHPEDLFRITQKEMPDRGEDLVAIYHSHTKSAAYPSQTDINAAASWPDPVYLIVSLEDPDDPDIKGFRLRDMKVGDVELSVE